MLIIVEGADGVGKSTLVAQLADELARRLDRQHNTRVRTIHRGTPRAHPLEEYEARLVDYRPGRDEHIICDRWHIGELVYPRFLGRPSQYDAACHRHVDLLLQSRGALVVYLEPPADIVRRWLTARTAPTDLDRQTLERYEELCSLFRHAIASCGTSHLSTDAPSLDRIIRLAELLEDHARRLNHLTTYVGPPRPDVLLFGETRGVNGRLAFGNLPAFVPTVGTSGHYLLSHLETLTQRVGLANACDVDHPTNVWEVLNQPRTVALGQTAAKRLRYLGIKHGVVPHPQYVRRFHHRHGESYARLIQEVALTGEDMSRWRP